MGYTAHGGRWRCNRCDGSWALEDLPVGTEQFAGFHDDEPLGYDRWTGAQWERIPMTPAKVAARMDAERKAAERAVAA